MINTTQDSYKTYKKDTPHLLDSLGRPDRPPFLLVFILLIHEILRTCFVQQEGEFIALVLRAAFVRLTFGRIERGGPIVCF